MPTVRIITSTLGRHTFWRSSHIILVALLKSIRSYGLRPPSRPRHGFESSAPRLPRPGMRTPALPSPAAPLFHPAPQLETLASPSPVDANRLLPSSSRASNAMIHCID